MNPPDTDEFEVTVLGRGVGECIVVHLLENRWMIVDSFRMRQVPVAQQYLDDLGVTPDRVEVIVVTHFHVDHYRGVDLLHDHYENARLMITAALDGAEFKA